MNNRLQELTDKIYQEGVSKGSGEAEKIIADAKSEAEKIVENAKKDAEKIVSDSEKGASELMKNTESEIRLAAQQATDALKQEITNIVNGSITEPAIKAAMSDIAFVQKSIEVAVKNWAANINEELSMEILVPAGDEKTISDYFSKTAKGVLDKGFSIKEVNNIKTGFQVAPADGSYKVSFTEDDFVNFFKEFLRPKVVELLFGK
jgi:V/A-type H+-transporting ATPase subunit E